MYFHPPGREWTGSWLFHPWAVLCMSLHPPLKAGQTEFPPDRLLCQSWSYAPVDQPQTHTIWFTLACLRNNYEYFSSYLVKTKSSNKIAIIISVGSWITHTGVEEISRSLRIMCSSAALDRGSVCSHSLTFPCSDTSTCQPSERSAITTHTHRDGGMAVFLYFIECTKKLLLKEISINTAVIKGNCVLWLVEKLCDDYFLLIILSDLAKWQVKRQGSNSTHRRVLNLLRHAQKHKTPLWPKANSENTWCYVTGQRNRLRYFSWTRITYLLLVHAITLAFCTRSSSGAWQTDSITLYWYSTAEQTSVQNQHHMVQELFHTQETLLTQEE